VNGRVGPVHPRTLLIWKKVMFFNVRKQFWLTACLLMVNGIFLIHLID
jgi:hypothetical protein